MSPTPTPSPSPIVIDDEGFNQHDTLSDALAQQEQIHIALTAGAPSVSVSCPVGTSMAKCAVTQAQLQVRAEEMFSIPPHSGEFTTIGECPALKELPASFPVHFLPSVCPDPHTASTSTLTQDQFNALMDGQPASNAAAPVAGIVLSILVLTAAAVAFLRHRRRNSTSPAPAPAEATP